MGSDESHFNVSVGSDGQSHKTVSTNHNHFEEKEGRSGLEPRSFRLPAYRLTARPNRPTYTGKNHTSVLHSAHRQRNWGEVIPHKAHIMGKWRKIIHGFYIKHTSRAREGKSPLSFTFSTHAGKITPQIYIQRARRENNSSVLHSAHTQGNWKITSQFYIQNTGRENEGKITPQF